MKAAEEELGNCLHNIFYHYTPSTDDALFLKKARSIITAHKLQAIKSLYKFSRKPMPPLLIYRELPLQQEYDGIVYRGEADLVWETADDLILVDYKSYPGKKEHILIQNTANTQAAMPVSFSANVKCSTKVTHRASM